ncbi:P1 family peptidase [Ramlibacter albus]|uniref:P1 family peptidase n=1 Tax=Ramlibacter albus TaxID=2079448 RepID=A0A923MAV1_9BURK|nr:P1 family peptidase [Ramlibacter albus]MBC5765944.1 P1 family peptidase [Ramlibacter albus]
MSSITDVAGIEVGHFTDPRRPTGCTVVITREGAVGGVDVRGAAPGTRETDLLSPTNLVEQVHAVVLSGGSAWGLDAASGAMRWLDEHGIGLQVAKGRVPIVPAAVLFDLYMGDPSIRPDANAGYAACAAASKQPPQEGCVGAGTGAIVGKIFGMDRAMKGGIGSASVTAHGITVGALIACNALGDVIDPATGQVVAGARADDGKSLLNTQQAMVRGDPHKRIIPGSNTTIGVVATDAVLTKPQASRLATVGHDGLARAINPAHTMFDGDTLFALATGKAGKPLDMLTLSAMAAEAVAQAVLRAVRAATSLDFDGLKLPAARDFAARQ